MEDETGLEEPFSHLDGPAPAFRQRDDRYLRPRILAWSQPRRVKIALFYVFWKIHQLSRTFLNSLPGALSVTHLPRSSCREDLPSLCVQGQHNGRLMARLCAELEGSLIVIDASCEPPGKLFSNTHSSHTHLSSSEPDRRL